MVSALISGASGHGWMTTPLSRASIHCPDYQGNPYYCISHQGETNGACKPGDLPCGECDPPRCVAGLYPGSAVPPEPYCNPNQMPNTSWLETPGEVQARYTAGDTVEVAWVVSVNHRGMYQYRLCLDGSDTENCFKETQLRFEDGELWHDLPSPCTTCTGYADDHGARVPLMVDRVVIPSGIQCDRCTLSWRWDAYTESTIFTGCADVSISAITPLPPPPLPTPSPTPPTTGGQCCYGGGCSSCNGAGEWCSSSASNCEGSCGGTYCRQGSSSLRQVTKHE